MNVAGLFLRVLDNKGDVYLPYSFNGNWTDKEKAEIEGIIKFYVPEKVDAMFNNWQFSKYGDTFLGSRATWDTRALGGSLEKLANDIFDYYSRYA